MFLISIPFSLVYVSSFWFKDREFIKRSQASSFALHLLLPLFGFVLNLPCDPGRDVGGAWRASFSASEASTNTAKKSRTGTAKRCWCIWTTTSLSSHTPPQMQLSFPPQLSFFLLSSLFVKLLWIFLCSISPFLLRAIWLFFPVVSLWARRPVVEERWSRSPREEWFRCGTPDRGSRLQVGTIDSPCVFIC